MSCRPSTRQAGTKGSLQLWDQSLRSAPRSPSKRLTLVKYLEGSDLSIEHQWLRVASPHLDGSSVARARRHPLIGKFGGSGTSFILSKTTNKTRCNPLNPFSVSCFLCLVALRDPGPTDSAFETYIEYVLGINHRQSNARPCIVIRHHG